MITRKQILLLLIGSLLLRCHPVRPVRTTTQPAPVPAGVDNPRAELPKPERQPTPTVPTPAQPPSEPPRTEEDMAKKLEILLAALQDAYFDYDQHDLRADAIRTLQEDAAVVKSILENFPAMKLMIEGHCDERGSPEYNLGLGDLRAQRAREFLAQLGVPVSQVATISFGKERPQCTERDESCWQRNRRAHFRANR